MSFGKSERRLSRNAIRIAESDDDDDDDKKDVTVSMINTRIKRTNFGKETVLLQVYIHLRTLYI